MARYAYVENDQVKELFDYIPNNWRNYSNFFALENDLDFLRSIGWYPIIIEPPLFDPDTQKISTQHKYYVRDNVVIETREVENIDAAT